MFKTMISAAALLASLFGSSWAIAHSGHSHRQQNVTASSNNERTWTDASRAFHLNGAFVAAKDGQVQIRRPDDSLVTLKLSQLIESDQRWDEQRLAEIRRANDAVAPPSRSVPIPINHDAEAEDQPAMELLAANELPLLLAQLEQANSRPDGGTVPDIAKAFEAFVKTKAIRTRWDDHFFYVESNGIPNHHMMIGITAWQQQVPLPQSYFGDNAWRMPLYPVPAKNPQSAKNHFLRGAIALAANGVPIFKPLNNRGDDAYLFGELDEFGGHCGRADDYHYHLPPVHLQKAVGKGLPIAYALDGYPIYGYEEPDGLKVEGLDTFNGHKDEHGHYHYHATKTYPYLNGGFYGEVTERGGQVDPQPRAEPIRPDGRPLRDAKITDFVENKTGSYDLTYDVKGKKGTVRYTIADDGSVKFMFVDTSGKTTTETYSPKRRVPDGDDRRPPPRPGKNPPPRNDERTSDKTRRDYSAKPRSNLPQLVVTSSALDANGNISAEFTCDGASASPPVEWKNAPPQTKCFALSLWHIAPDQEKSYWVVYNIPANVTKLANNAKDTGTVGLNDKWRAEYDPMCSKGPGVKKYYITVYALSAQPKLSPDKANRANLLQAIKDITIAEGTLDFQYERKSNSLKTIVGVVTFALLMIAEVFYWSSHCCLSKQNAGIQLVVDNFKRARGQS